MDFQRQSFNDLFYGLGIEFHEETFSSIIAQSAANEIQDFFFLKNIKPEEKLKRKTLAWMYFKRHHLLSLVKKPNFFHMTYLFIYSIINGLKL